jgi:hypothetical protein
MDYQKHHKFIKNVKKSVLKMTSCSLFDTVMKVRLNYYMFQVAIRKIKLILTV